MIEDIPGYINSNVGMVRNKPNSFRFSQTKPKDDNPSLQPWVYKIIY